MIKNKILDWNEPVSRFREYFGYSCQYPIEANIDNEKDLQSFSNLVNKCIKDNFDYTIEKCGTVPPSYKGFPKIIVD